MTKTPSRRSAQGKWPFALTLLAMIGICAPAWYYVFKGLLSLLGVAV